jgi:hypothetical protein
VAELPETGDVREIVPPDAAERIGGDQAGDDDPPRLILSSRPATMTIAPQLRRRRGLCMFRVSRNVETDSHPRAFGDATRWSLALTPDVIVIGVGMNSQMAGDDETKLSTAVRRPARIDQHGNGTPVHLRIETFGRMYVQAHNCHTDAVGGDVAADAVSRVFIASGHGLSSCLSARGHC